MSERYVRRYTEAQKAAILRAASEGWTVREITELAKLGLLGVPPFKVNSSYLYQIIRIARVHAEAEGRELPGPGPAKNVLESLLSFAGQASGKAASLDADARALLRLIEAGRRDLLAGRSAESVAKALVEGLADLA